MGESAEAPHRVPVLGMLVDRTSFDETDDYGIDRVAIVDSIPISKLNAPVSTVLKNGKVRRRLRWRPKRRNEKGASTTTPTDSTESSDDARLQGPQEMVRSVSSNLSVHSHSNMSYSSKNSHRSTHSFSSTQTMARDNTKYSDKKARKFPLPRPNYPSTFDGVSTIENESTMVHARIIKGDADSTTLNNNDASSSTVFAAADLENIETTVTEENPEQEIRRSSSTPKKRSFPPLFRRKPPTVPRKISTEANASSGTETPPLSPHILRHTFSEPMPPSNNKKATSSPKSVVPPASPTSPTQSSENGDPASAPTPRIGSYTSPAEDLLLANDYYSGQDDLPIVEQDMLETNGRRVDLRIPEYRQSKPSKNDPALEAREAVLPSLSMTDKQEDELSRAVVLQRPLSLKWSRSDSAMASVANTCVDFLLSADPEDITTDLGGAPEIRFSMSEVGSCLSEPSLSSRTPSGLPARTLSNKLPSPKSSGAPKPPLPPKSALPPPRLPAPPSFSVETELSSPDPASPTAVSVTPTSSESPDSPQQEAIESEIIEEDPPLYAIESELSEDSPPSSSSAPVDVDDASFLDVEKNLQAIHDMGIEHLRHREYTEALEVFEEILRGQLTRYGEQHYRVGTALHNIGIVHMKQGDFDEAAHVSYEAVRIRKLTLPADHPDIAVSLSQLGVALLECRKFKKAIAHFRDALRIRRKCYGSKHLKVAKLLNNIGCALYELNELDVAKVAFEEALEIQRSTLREIPTQDLEEPTNQILLSIASTLSNIGSIKLYWGHTGAASIDLEESLLIQQSVLGDNHPFAKRTEECLEWIESQGGNSVAEDHNNLSGAFTDDAENKDGIRLCNSAVMSADQPKEDLLHMMELFNRNLLSFQTGFELACQGGEPLIQETQRGPPDSSS
eukprot:scaffold12163_cov176-Amphora_coffeaeformis.AAC.5